MVCSGLLPASFVFEREHDRRRQSTDLRFTSRRPRLAAPDIPTGAGPAPASFLMPAPPYRPPAFAADRCHRRNLLGRRSAVVQLLFGLVGASSSTAAPATDPRPMLSIVDGEASVGDGLRRQGAVEGLRLAPGTLLETSARSTLLRIEWPSGQVLDLGPETRAMLAPPQLSPRDRPGAVLYLLSGWAKLRTAVPGGSAVVLAPGYALGPFSGVVVAGAGAGDSLVFAESAAVSVVERGAPPLASHALNAGEAYVRAGSARGEVSAGAPTALLRRLPRSFRDTLPLRWQRLKDASVQGTPLPPPSHAELAPWLVAEPALRREFARRLAARAREPEFRAALIAQLPSHPEWQAVLFPPPPPQSQSQPYPAPAPRRPEVP
jgi:hypothetical protein